MSDIYLRPMAGLVSLALAVPVFGATFTPLPALDALPADVSADGSVVVGNLLFSDGFRWTADDGIVVLTGGVEVKDVTADGSIITGDVLDEFGVHTAGVWDETNGWVSLGGFPGATRVDFNLSNGYASSADGSVVTGLGWDLDPFLAHGFRWTEAEGMVDLGSSGGASRGSLISDDGTVIAGYDENPSFGNRRAARWTEATGWVTLGSLDPFDPIDGDGDVLGMSADGQTLVGSSASLAFRWTEADGMIDLGGVGGLPLSFAFDVSGDGETVVGTSRSLFGAGQAWVWRRGSGIRDLRELLLELGAPNGGWTFEDVAAVTPDGGTIVGSGVNSNGRLQGYVAELSDLGDGTALEVGELVAGASGTVEVSGMTPGAPVGLALSTSGPGWTRLASRNVTFDLDSLVFIASGTADSEGAVTLSFDVPSAAAGRTLWLQAGEAGSTTPYASTVVATP